MSTQSLPKYRKVTQTLEREIESGALRPGEAIPTFRTLMASERVGMTSVVKGVELLVASGLVTRLPNRGYVVADRSPSRLKGISQIVFITASLDSDTAAYSRAIDESLDHNRYSLAVCSSHANLGKYQRIFEHVGELQPGGVIVIAQSPELCKIDPAPLVEASIPVVVIGRPIDGLVCDRIIQTRTDSAEKMARHAIGLGCKTFGVYLFNYAGADNEEFLAALRRELAGAGLKLPDENVFYGDAPRGFTSDPDPYIDVQQQTQQILADGFRCDVWFHGHDYPAVGSLRAIQAAGIRVPEEMKVISAMRCAVNGATPTKLTTIDTHLQQQARLAGELVTRRIEGYAGPPEVHYISGDLMEGETT